MSTLNSAPPRVPDAPEEAPATTPAGGKANARGRFGAKFTPYSLLVPSIVVLGVVIGWPLINLIIMSFQKFGRAQVFGAPPEWIGFGNYAKVLGDPTFWEVLGRSLLFCLVCVVITMVLGTLIAMMMTRLTKFFRLLLSVGLLLAWAMPALTATIVWGWIFDTDYGVINNVLVNVFGLDFHQHSWLIDPVSFFFVAAIIVIWGAVPFVTFTVYAGLSQVPDEVLEAASLDGAGYLARFRLIVFPYLKSIFVVVTILQIIWDLRVFTQIYALQGIGGIKEQTSTLGVYIYQTSLGSGEYGIGGAIAVITVIILMAISLYYVRQSIKEEEL
ncbi:N,N'-diacetylchitobiose transport system permease protein [Mycetocola sp. BIGb0189]|uniref:carbohydrate ABC transporter permease n=1 Tax=Mycetocola sp. BIGb0189 TaxID=2940604 RepID=UPI00216831CC|nr:sugar ABC transporter permease [Mycetocola sp. BIGb0189]MCS4276583.1 N,N'-diacetylchitobiose transport system permease protein [Mycetocola sp. BIGb0189]